MRHAVLMLIEHFCGEGQTPRYPICFLTNGGGNTEAQKATQLSQWLDVSVTADQVTFFD